jgi:hypothetical protein
MANRRKFLIGMGSLAAGSAAAFGTSATTTFDLDNKNVNANVVTDSSGAVALQDGEQGGIINHTGGELEIDFAEGSASGVGVGSRVDIGGPSSPGDSAFTITNQTTAEIDITLEFETADSSLSKFETDFEANENGSEIVFNPYNNDTESNIRYPIRATDIHSPGDTISETFEDVSSGGTIAVAVSVIADQPGSAPNENLSGVLNITATRD